MSDIEARQHAAMHLIRESNTELRSSRSLWRCLAILEGAALAGIVWGIARGWL